MRRAACAFVGGHGGAVVGGAFGAGSGFRVGECTVEGGWGCGGGGCGGGGGGLNYIWILGGTLGTGLSFYEALSCCSATRQTTLICYLYYL